MQSKYAIFVLSYDSDSDQPVNDLQGDKHDVGSSISGKLEASESWSVWAESAEEEETELDRIQD